MSEICDIDKLPESIFPINFKIIDRYQWKDPSLMAQLKTGKYKRSYFCAESNNNFNLITCEDKIDIP